MMQLRGVRVHNLQDLDVDIPTRKLVAVCGVSGSGKTSLALDTLYAEGQRRYIESFSAYTRQFLERLEKPDADRLDGLPPAIAVAAQSARGNRRSTVATTTEISDYLRLLLARIGKIVCQTCNREVRRDSPDSIAAWIEQRMDSATRWMLAFTASDHEPSDPEVGLLRSYAERGFVRAVVNHRSVRIDEPSESGSEHVPLIVVDRLRGVPESGRLRDSLEVAFSAGERNCTLLIEGSSDGGSSDGGSSDGGSSSQVGSGDLNSTFLIDDRPWQRHDFSGDLTCSGCGTEYLEPSPQLFSFNHSLGACPTCEGFGNTLDLDTQLIVPDPSKSIRDGAIAPWTTPAYQHEWEELTSLAAAEGIDVDCPYAELDIAALHKIQHGVPARDFGGLDGFFAWLERRKYKMQIRVFLNRWKSESPCVDCDGQRLRREALAVRVGGQNYADICRLSVSEAAQFFSALELNDRDREIASVMLEQLAARLGYLQTIGLDYLTLDRAVRDLSGGEAQRVALTKTLGSSLVNLLYVMDEPSAGLHAHDTERLKAALFRIRDRGNSVIIVEHEESLLKSADHIIEIGPRAGREGGRLVYSGDCDGLLADAESLTGAYLSGKLLGGGKQQRRSSRGVIQLTGARGNNLQNVDVDFPLGVLCLVTGVSGAGKSTLVQRTLYGALSRHLHADPKPALPYDQLHGAGQIDDVVRIDQSPIGRSPRSNPVTYVKAFDAIRKLFAETVEAKSRNFGVGHFSFNSEQGRCEECCGDGSLEVDMQFLADMRVPCPRCRGTRYRKDVLDVRYRGCTISDVLSMTVRESLGFFRGQTKIQNKLQPLMEVGLGYLALGQSATTLSRGEAQRLKLSSYLGKATRSRTLFLLDEPTAGLHFADVVKLIDCFDALLGVGHSLVVVEHNLQLMTASDHLIDLGPGPGREGGMVVVAGTPEQVAECPHSSTGQYLQPRLSRL